MSAGLPVQPADVFVRRRNALAAKLGSTPALVFAGGLRSRNYPANVYPYRADSHFLYLVGAAIPGSAVWIEGDRSELFVPPHAPDDTLWHGELLTLDEIATATGATGVHEFGELAQMIDGASSVATLASLDPLTRARQAQMLARPWPADGFPAASTMNTIDTSLAVAMIDLRLRHDDAAIDMIRRAVAGTTAAHAAGMAITRAGLLEHDVRAAMERELLARDMQTAYGSIVTVHGEVLHNTSYHHELRDGDLLLADLGGEYAGWSSDVTRTWPVSGRFSGSQRALYDLVVQANRDAIAMVRPGVRYRDIHRRAAVTLATGLVDEGVFAGDPETLVERGVHALLFPHGVGHLLGLDVHDMEDLGDLAGYARGRTRSDQFGTAYLRLDRDLEPGMVVTIEPGLYAVPAILRDDALCGQFVADGSFRPDRLRERFGDVRGIRVEDDVLCTPTGAEVLTHAIPKDASAVEAAMGSC